MRRESRVGMERMRRAASALWTMFLRAWPAKPMASVPRMCMAPTSPTIRERNRRSDIWLMGSKRSELDDRWHHAAQASVTKASSGSCRSAASPSSMAAPMPGMNLGIPVLGFTSGLANSRSRPLTCEAISRTATAAAAAAFRSS
eukprot:2295400-Pyramimonas_sp.AAC.3